MFPIKAEILVRTDPETATTLGLHPIFPQNAKFAMARAAYGLNNYYVTDGNLETRNVLRTYATVEAEIVPERPVRVDSGKQCRHVCRGCLQRAR